MKKILISTIAAAALFTMVAVAQPSEISAAGRSRLDRFGRRASLKMNTRTTPPDNEGSRPAGRSRLVYVLTVAPGGLGVIGFGVVDPGGGGFAPIGSGFQPDQPGAGTGLAPGGRHFRADSQLQRQSRRD